MDKILCMLALGLLCACSGENRTNGPFDPGPLSEADDPFDPGPLDQTEADKINMPQTL